MKQLLLATVCLMAQLLQMQPEGLRFEQLRANSQGSVFLLLIGPSKGCPIGTLLKEVGRNAAPPLQTAAFEQCFMWRENARTLDRPGGLFKNQAGH